MLLSSLSISLSSLVLDSLKYNTKIKSQYINIIDNILKDNLVEFNKKGVNINGINTLRSSLEDDSLSLLLNKNNIDDYSFIKDISKWGDLISISYCEHLFYRYISIDCINYKESGIDPFVISKFDDLSNSQTFIEDICLRINDIIDLPIEDALKTVLHISLWGSKKDCKGFSTDSIGSSSSSSAKGTIAKKRNSFFSGLSSKNNNILDDRSNSIIDLLTSSSDSKDIGIVTGQTGKELFSDLVLAHVLLSFKVCETVTFYCKGYPSMLHGVTPTDLYGHIEHLADRSKSNVWAVHILGNALRNHFQLDQFRIQSDDYWCNQHQSFKEISPTVKEQTANSKLLIIKGDKNYQRLVDTRDWSTSIDQDIKNLLDSDWHKIPICIISTIQAENVYGISKEELRRALTYERNFSKDGNFGLIQFKN